MAKNCYVRKVGEPNHLDRKKIPKAEESIYNLFLCRGMHLSHSKSNCLNSINSVWIGAFVAVFIILSQTWVVARFLRTWNRNIEYEFGSGAAQLINEHKNYAHSTFIWMWMWLSIAKFAYKYFFVELKRLQRYQFCLQFEMHTFLRLYFFSSLTIFDWNDKVKEKINYPMQFDR